MVEQLHLDEVGTAAFLDTIYGLLADSRRRNVLQYLLTSSQTASLYRLATAVAASEHEVPPEDVTTEHVAEELLLLRHVHLPMLDETGLLEWDRDADYVTLTPLLDQLSIQVSHPGGLFDMSMDVRPQKQ